MSAARSPQLVPTATHWGTYLAEVRGGRVVALHPHPDDPEPSPIGGSMPGALTGPCRVAAPAVRREWLERGPARDRGGRGAGPFVRVSWDHALELAAGELDRVRRAHGNAAIYGGSYGWASAGRFHHAQSQIHRFLNQLGGCTRSRNTYSTAAAEVIMPRVLAPLRTLLTREATTWPVIAAHTRLFATFGGIALKNAQVNPGGVGRHGVAASLRRCREAGTEFVSLSPLADDAAAELGAQWLALRPGTDTAVMLGLAHTLLVEGLHDEAFLDRYCVGFGRLRAYLLGETDGTPRDAAWAGAIADLEPEAIRALARRMAGTRTLVNVSWSVQRGDHGEQPYWMAVALAAMLGQIGLPGGGLGFGYAAIHGVGEASPQLRLASLPQGENPVGIAIPVARVADMLLHPGETIDYDGGRVTYPDIRLVYWAGGNPFHHHQDLNRLVRAWQRPETVIVHEPFWTPLARHADIVLPATTALERNDLAATSHDGSLVAMHRAVAPVGEARNDHDIFAALAARLGFGGRFTEGRGEMDWLHALYERSRDSARAAGIALPDFDEFWAAGVTTLPGEPVHRVQLAAFRADPESSPLPTPSGRIELFSETIAGFGYADCPGHPLWLEPAEWLGAAAAARHPLHLVSNQPATRLHSQYDHGAVSRASKVGGREPLRMHPADAAARGIRGGDVVRVFNDRGECLAGAVLSEALRRGVVQLATGAWYDPEQPGVPGTPCKHGNPNVLTRDKGSSRLAQAPSPQSTLVEVARFVGEPPPVTAFAPPPVDEGGA